MDVSRCLLLPAACRHRSMCLLPHRLLRSRRHYLAYRRLPPVSCRHGLHTTCLVRSTPPTCRFGCYGFLPTATAPPLFPATILFLLPATYLPFFIFAIPAASDYRRHYHLLCHTAAVSPLFATATPLPAGYATCGCHRTWMPRMTTDGTCNVPPAAAATTTCHLPFYRLLPTLTNARIPLVAHRLCVCVTYCCRFTWVLPPACLPPYLPACLLDGFLSAPPPYYCRICICCMDATPVGLLLWMNFTTNHGSAPVIAFLDSFCRVSHWISWLIHDIPAAAATSPLVPDTPRHRLPLAHAMTWLRRRFRTVSCAVIDGHIGSPTRRSTVPRRRHAHSPPTHTARTRRIITTLLPYRSMNARRVVNLATRICC